MATFSSPRTCAVILLCLSLLVLGGCGKVETSTEAPQAPAAAAASPAQKSATPNSFDEVAAQLDPGGDLYVYLSTAQWLGKLSQGIDTLHEMVLSGSGGAAVPNPQQAEKGFSVLKDIVQKSGIEEISGMGVSSFAVSPGLHRNKIFLHHYADKGSGILWSICGTAPHALTGLDFLPADTATASFGDFNLAQLINFLRQEVDQSGVPEAKQAVAQWQTQFAGVSGLQLDDVLKSLNGSMGLVLTLDASNTISIPIQNQAQTIPSPRLAILFAVKNDLVFKQVDKMLSGNPGVIKVDEPDLRMRTMPLPFLPALNLRPSVAQWNDFLVIASDDQLIRNMIAVQKGAPGYKSTAEYAALSAGLPQQGNRFGVVTERFSDTIRKIQTQMYANQPNVNPAQAAFMQRWIALCQRGNHGFGVGVRLPNGLLTVSQTKFSAP